MRARFEPVQVGRARWRQQRCSLEARNRVVWAECQKINWAVMLRKLSVTGEAERKEKSGVKNEILTGPNPLVSPG